MRPAHLLVACAICVALATGMFLQRTFGDSSVATEIMRNEQRCDPERRPGYAVYTVTRYGELRGCLRVRQDVVDGIRSAPILIVKKPDLM